MSSKPKSIALNFFMNFLLQASSILFPLITFPYVSRVLGPEGTGSVAMGTSLVSYFILIAMLGIPTYGIRAVARARDNKQELSKTVQELLIINLAMGAIAYLLFFITILIVPSFRAMDTLYCICSIAIGLNVIGVLWVYQGLEEYPYITGATLLFKVIGLVMMFLLVRSSQDALWYALATVIGGFGSGIVNFIRLRKLVSLRPVGHYNFRQHFKPLLTFFAMAAATTVYTNMDVVMLGLMKNSTEVGYYNAAIKVKVIMVQLVTSLGGVLLPRMSEYIQHKKMKEVRRMAAKAMSFVLLFSIPVCIYFSVFAQDIILVLSGEQYLPSITPMIILMPTILLIGLSNLTGMQLLVPMGREVIVLVSVVAGALIDFFLNLILIPLFGSSGAAIGTLAAEFAVTLYQGWYLHKTLKKILPDVEFRALLFGIIPFGLSVAACSLWIHLPPFGSLCTTAVICFGVYGLSLAAARESILMETMQRVFRRIS